MHHKGAKSIKKSLLIIITIAALATGGALVWQSQIVPELKARAVTLLPFLANVSQLQPSHESKTIAYKFAVLSDSHQDTQYFPHIVDEIAARQDIAFVAHLGDVSDAGDKAKLQQGKDTLDRIAEPVYVLPGDHDLNWFPAHDLTNFLQVFKQKRSYFSLNHGSEHFLFIDNSDLNNGISQTQWQWITEDLAAHADQTTYVFMSTPLSNPYLAFKAMGSQSQTVKDQAVQLGQLLKKYPVRAIFAGDTHTFAQYTDHDSQLPIITVGASGATKNLLPLYVIVDIFSDGSYNVTSIPYQHAIPVQGAD